MARTPRSADEIKFNLDVNWRISEYFEDNDISKRSFAKKLNIDYQTFINYTKETTPSLMMLTAIAREMGVTTDYLLGLSKNPSKVGGDEYGAVETTGLSERAVNKLKTISLSQESYNIADSSKMLSRIIESDRYLNLMSQMEEWQNTDTAFVRTRALKLLIKAFAEELDIHEEREEDFIDEINEISDNELGGVAYELLYSPYQSSVQRSEFEDVLFKHANTSGVWTCCDTDEVNYARQKGGIRYEVYENFGHIISEANIKHITRTKKQLKKDLAEILDHIVQFMEEEWLMADYSMDASNTQKDIEKICKAKTAARSKIDDIIQNTLIAMEKGG